MFYSQVCLAQVCQAPWLEWQVCPHPCARPPYHSTDISSESKIQPPCHTIGFTSELRTWPPYLSNNLTSDSKILSLRPSSDVTSESSHSTNYFTPLNTLTPTMGAVHQMRCCSLAAQNAWHHSVSPMSAAQIQANPVVGSGVGWEGTYKATSNSAVIIQSCPMKPSCSQHCCCCKEGKQHFCCLGGFTNGNH